jgi:hypothetical protein
MNQESWQNGHKSTEPPAGWPPLAVALWAEAHGDWQRAHQIAQDENTAEGAWVHAYLHRREGDTVNAAYWYRRAAKPVERGDLDSERASIAHSLLQTEEPLG